MPFIMYLYLAIIVENEIMFAYHASYQIIPDIQ